jgi:sodium/proline symporter
MCAALVAVPITAISVSGGWHEVVKSIGAANPALLEPFTNATGTTLSLLSILSLLGWGLGYFGQPHILARFMAINSPARLPKARRIAMTWVTISMTGALLVGFTGIVAHPEILTGAETEKIFINLVGLLFHPVLAGVWLAAILAAIMSTADSQLLVASAALTHDFYQVVIRKEAGQKELLLVGRFGVAGIAAAAFVLALNPDNKVLDLVAYAWAGFGAAFGPTLILALFWRRMTKSGAAAGILTGGLTVILWKQLHGGIFDMYEIIPGFLFSALAILVASLASPEPAPELLAQFDKVRQDDSSA